MGDVKYWESTYSKALDQFEGEQRSRIQEIWLPNLIHISYSYVLSDLGSVLNSFTGFIVKVASTPDVSLLRGIYQYRNCPFRCIHIQAEKSKQEARDSAIADAAKCDITFFLNHFLLYVLLNRNIFLNLLARCERRIDGIRRSYNLEVRLIKEV